MAQNSRRGRGSRRRQGGNSNPNRSMDSQGPEVKIRGTAQQIYDKYVGLARDAFSAGDRIRGESLQQHAEHYYRLLKSMQPTEKREREDGDQADDGGRGDQPSFQQEDRPAAQADSPSDRDAVEKDTDPASGAASASTSEDDAPKARRSRRRRTRRGEDDEGEGESEGSTHASADGEGQSAAKGAPRDEAEAPAPKKRASRSKKKQEEPDDEISAA